MRRILCILLVLGYPVSTCAVITVLIKESAPLISWSERPVQSLADKVEIENKISVYDPDNDTFTYPGDVVSFYNKVWTYFSNNKSSWNSWEGGSDTMSLPHRVTSTLATPLVATSRHQECPIDFFRQRLLAYITTSTRPCNRISDVTRAAVVAVDTYAFDFMIFASEYLYSWATTPKIHSSFALLFDYSGEGYFLLPNKNPQNRLVFEVTLPLVNCSDSDHVTSLAAQTNIKDVLLIATSGCITDMLRALPVTGTQQRLLGFATDAIQSFVKYVTNNTIGSCSLDCTTNCSPCQDLFKDALREVDSRKHSIFTPQQAAVKRDIVFGLMRLNSGGNVHLGNWSQSDGLRLNQPAYPPSFIDSQLTVAVIVEPPFIFKNESQPGSYYGYSIDVLEEIASRVGFSYTLRECDEGGYGVLDSGEWSGCIGNIVRGEADVILGAMTVTAERDTVLDFTLPYYDFAGIQILLKKQTAKIDLFYYGNVFSPHAWLCLGAVVLVTSLLLWAFENITSTGRKEGRYTVNKRDLRQDSVPLNTVSSKESKLTPTKDPNLTLTKDSHLTLTKDPNLTLTKDSHLTLTKDPNLTLTKDSLLTPTKDSLLTPTKDSKLTLTNEKDTFSQTGELCKVQGRVLAYNNQTFSNREFDPGSESKLKQKGELEAMEKTPLPTVVDTLWFVIGALTMAGGGEPPHSLSGRFLVTGFWFFAIIMMSTFTANLAAFLTVSRMGMTVTSLDTLAAQSDIKYSVVDKTSVMDYFKRMAKIEADFYERWKNMSLEKTDRNQDSLAVWEYPLGNKYGAIWRTIQETGLVSSVEVGLDKVLNENFALITESPLIQYYTGKNCLLSAVGDQFSVRPYAIGLKERSTYAYKFSEAILQLQKERLLGSIRLKWWSNSDAVCPKETGDSGLDLYSLSGTFIIAGVGIGAGLIVLSLEHVIKWLSDFRVRGASREF